MKAVHLLKTTEGARWALIQLRELSRRGIECHVVLPNDRGIAPLYTAGGVQVHIIDFTPGALGSKWINAAKALRVLVDRIRPDVVHSHFVATTLLMRWALAGTTYTRVFQVPGPLHLENSLTATLDISTAAATDYWIGACEWTRREYVRRGVHASRVFMAHYGFALESFVLGPRGHLRRELGVSASTRIAGMVAYCYRPKRYLGNTRGIKGHEDFIDAVWLLRQQGVEVIGVIVGGPWLGAETYYTKVQRHAASRRDSGIHFLGSREDVLELYADFDVAVHPSLSENLGGAAESLLLGVPTVTTTVGGFPDLIQDHVTGLMVPPRSPECLASAIRRVFEEPCWAAATAAEGQRHAGELLDVRRTAAQVADIYEALRSSAVDQAATSLMRQPDPDVTLQSRR